MPASFVCPTFPAAPSHSALTFRPSVFLFGSSSIRQVGVVNSGYLGRGGMGEFPLCPSQDVLSLLVAHVPAVLLPAWDLGSSSSFALSSAAPRLRLPFANLHQMTLRESSACQGRATTAPPQPLHCSSLSQLSQVSPWVLSPSPPQSSSGAPVRMGITPLSMAAHASVLSIQKAEARWGGGISRSRLAWATW